MSSLNIHAPAPGGYPQGIASLVTGGHAVKRIALQRYRRELALSQADIAAACGVDTSTVYRWEAGESSPMPVHCRLLAGVLGLRPRDVMALLEGNPAGLPLPPPDPDRPAAAGLPAGTVAALEWITDEPSGPLHAMAADGPGRTRRVGGDLLEQAASRIIRFRLADDITPTRILLPEVTGEIERVETILNCHSYTDQTGRRLHGMLAELYQLAGWLAIDQGLTARGEQHYAAGAQAAKTSGDNILVAQMFSCNAYQQSSRGMDALLLARAALHGAGHGQRITPLARILFTERIAWAAAVNGDTLTCRRALGDIDDAYSQAGTEPEPHWTYWLSRDESDVMAARCHLRIGNPHRATVLLRPAIARYPQDHRREKALYLSWLAEAHVTSGDLDAASAVIDEIETLNVDSHRLRVRLHALA
jgi:transcriptional regulator with XRE-family HTH domain